MHPFRSRYARFDQLPSPVSPAPELQACATRSHIVLAPDTDDT